MITRWPRSFRGDYIQRFSSHKAVTLLKRSNKLWLMCDSGHLIKEIVRVPHHETELHIEALRDKIKKLKSRWQVQPRKCLLAQTKYITSEVLWQNHSTVLSSRRSLHRDHWDPQRASMKLLVIRQSSSSSMWLQKLKLMLSKKLESWNLNHGLRTCKMTSPRLTVKRSKHLLIVMRILNQTQKKLSIIDTWTVHLMSMSIDLSSCHYCLLKHQRVHLTKDHSLTVKWPVLKVKRLIVILALHREWKSSKRLTSLTSMSERFLLTVLMTCHQIILLSHLIQSNSFWSHDLHLQEHEIKGYSRAIYLPRIEIVQSTL